jgi:hypothetical protein
MTGALSMPLKLFPTFNRQIVVKNPVSVATPVQLMWSHVPPTDDCAIAAGLNRMCR